MYGRWSDLVDIAATSTGHPYPSTAEIEWVLWERTPYPMGSADQVWRALLAHYRDER